MLNDTMKISLTLVAFDKMSKVIKDAVNSTNSDFDKMQQKIQSASDKLTNIGKTASIVGGALVGLGAVNLKLAADFDAQMTNVSTLIDTNIENFSAMKEEVLDIAKRTPVALDGLTSALYDIRSAGISADMQFKVLERSAQLGMTGLGSTSEAVDLVTSSLNAFNLQGEKAEKVYDTIFKTVKYGKTTISGIAQGFGSVAGTVAAAGIELDDYLAAVAALTTTGQPAAQAHHQLKAAIAGMTRESEDATKVFKQLGVNNFKELIQKSGGMVNAFKAISDCVKGNDSAILGLFGSTMAYNAVLGLTTKQSKSYLETLDSMRNGANLLDEGYRKQFNTEHSQMQRLKNLTQTIGIQLGEALAPMFKKVIDFAYLIVSIFDKLPKGAKSFIAISITGFGVLVSAFGAACLIGGKLLSFYGGFIEKARELTPLLIKNSAKLLEFMGLNSTSKTISMGLNIKGGNTSGLFGSLFSDIKRIDNNLRAGIVKSFKELPGNISRAAASMKVWAATSIKAIPSNFMAGLNGLKATFLGIPSMIGRAIMAFRAFSLTLLTSPIGWIALAIAAVVFLIYKFWKPITEFFKGLWQGLKAGLQPLMPVFKQVVHALQPIITPIKAIINWFKKLIKPVEDTGGAAQNMGVKVGKALATVIVKVVQFVAKIFEFGIKIPIMIAKGILAGVDKVKDAISKITQTIRDHLPHSPAKTGPLKDLHKIKLVETIASTIKPAPIMSAMSKTMGIVSSGIKVSASNFIKGGGGSTVINYNPTITISGDSNNSKEEFLVLLKRHKDELIRLINQENQRKMRLAY